MKDGKAFKNCDIAKSMQLGLSFQKILLQTKTDKNWKRPNMCYIFEKQALRGYQKTDRGCCDKVGKSESQNVRKSENQRCYLHLWCRFWFLSQYSTQKFRSNVVRYDNLIYENLSQINYADHFTTVVTVQLFFLNFHSISHQGTKLILLIIFQFISLSVLNLLFFLAKKKLIKLRRQKNQTPHYPFQAPRLFLLGTAIHSQVPQPTSKH